MKFAAAALIAATASAWDAEFMRGAQTGFFLNSDEQFEEYSCPAPGLNPSVQSFINMAMPMKVMFDNMNQGTPSPMIDLLFNSVTSLARISSLFDEEYDGGEFCQGLLFSKDASKFVWAIGSRIMDRMNAVDEDEPEEVYTTKQLALESKLH